MMTWASLCLTEPVLCLFCINGFCVSHMPCLICKLHRPCLLDEFLIPIGHKPVGKVFRLTQLCHVRCHLI